MKVSLGNRNILSKDEEVEFDFADVKKNIVGFDPNNMGKNENKGDTYSSKHGSHISYIFKGYDPLHKVFRFDKVESD